MHPFSYKKQNLITLRKTIKNLNNHIFLWMKQRITHYDMKAPQLNITLQFSFSFFSLTLNA